MATGIGGAQSRVGIRILRRTARQQIELLKFMSQRYPQVSWELILSGRGFRTIHEFLAPSVKHPVFEDPDADPAPFITKKWA